MKYKNAVITLIILLTFALVWLVINIIDIRISAVISQGENDSDTPHIVLDAGHGGLDGGAVGYDGIVEKDINLKITLAVRDYLRMSGFDVTMTRENDISIHDNSANTVKEKKTSDLHNRMKIMEEVNNKRPDSVFISVHQNKFTQQKYSGAQVFYSDNYEDSKALADCLQKSIVSNLQEDNKREIKPAGSAIFLLDKAKSTAVMIECGFLSNPDEARLLNSEEYQKQMAFSIFCGILDYAKSKSLVDGETII